MTKEEAKNFIAAIRSEFPDDKITSIIDAKDDTCCIAGALFQYVLKNPSVLKRELYKSPFKYFNSSGPYFYIDISLFSCRYLCENTLYDLLCHLNTAFDNAYSICKKFSRTITDMNDNRNFECAWKKLTEALAFRDCINESTTDNL